MMAISTGPEFWGALAAIVTVTPIILKGVISAFQYIYQGRRCYGDLAIAGTKTAIAGNEGLAVFKLAHSGVSHLNVESVEIQSQLKLVGAKHGFGGWIAIALALLRNDIKTLSHIVTSQEDFLNPRTLFSKIWSGPALPLVPRYAMADPAKKNIKLVSILNQIERITLILAYLMVFLYPLTLFFLAISSPFRIISVRLRDGSLRLTDGTSLIIPPFLIGPNMETELQVSYGTSANFLALEQIAIKNESLPFWKLPKHGEPIIWEFEQTLRLRAGRRKIAPIKLGSCYVVVAAEGMVNGSSDGSDDGDV